MVYLKKSTKTFTGIDCHKLAEAFGAKWSRVNNVAVSIQWKVSPVMEQALLPKHLQGGGRKSLYNSFTNILIINCFVVLNWMNCRTLSVVSVILSTSFMFLQVIVKLVVGFELSGWGEKLWYNRLISSVHSAHFDSGRVTFYKGSPVRSVPFTFSFLLFYTEYILCAA